MHKTALLLLASSLIASSCAANPHFVPECVYFCSSDCVKPIAVPDRWDDLSFNWPGWSGNGRYDAENFSDTNGNGIWDSGEPFVDGSNWSSGGTAGPKDGAYNAELYDPVLTGYVASKDLGAQVTLVPGGTTAPNLSYYSLNLPGATSYSSDLHNCNPSIISMGDLVPTESGIVFGATAQAMRDLINSDPTAAWDPGCMCATGPNADQSPRYLILLGIDPRRALTPSDHRVAVTKLIGFFLESSRSDGEFTGRFAHVQHAGTNSCSNGGDFVRDCAVPSQASSWGAMKASYR